MDRLSAHGDGNLRWQADLGSCNAFCSPSAFDFEGGGRSEVVFLQGGVGSDSVANVLDGSLLVTNISDAGLVPSVEGHSWPASNTYWTQLGEDPAALRVTDHGDPHAATITARPSWLADEGAPRSDEHFHVCRADRPDALVFQVGLEPVSLTEIIDSTAATDRSLLPRCHYFRILAADDCEQESPD